MATKPLAIILVFATTFLLSIAQVFLKKGANLLSFNLLELITNYNLITGLGIYVFALFVVIFALKHGEVSTLYPIIALSYIWVTILASSIFNEPVNPLKWAGIAAIFLGVSLIGLGGRE